MLILLYFPMFHLTFPYPVFALGQLGLGLYCGLFLFKIIIYKGGNVHFSFFRLRYYFSVMAIMAIIGIFVRNGHNDHNKKNIFELKL